MDRPTARLALALLALCGTLLASGCGRGGATDTASGPAAAPSLGAPRDTGTSADDDAAPPPVPVPAPAADLGFPAVATKNTTRVGSSDAVAVAAATARAVFPGADAASRPDAVAVVDRGDWRAALAASALMGAPLRAPLLLSDDGATLPAASQAALDALAPTGSKAAGGAQVIRVGDVPRPTGVKTTDVAGRDPFALAQALDAFAAAARGKTSDSVIVVSADAPQYAAPAAAYAAKSGDPILFARRDSLPSATRAALRTHQQPKIYLLGPAAAVGRKVADQLRGLGSVTRIEGADPVRNAIAFARFAETDFGWGIVDPGHGLVFTDADADPALAAAAAPLSASGTYGPLLLVDDAQRPDTPLRTFLRGIQPGYRTDPTRGVYNHGWLVGDTAALTPALQARLDTLLEIMPETIDTPAAP